MPDAFDPRISLSVPKIAKWSGTEIALTSFICFNEAVLLESELIQKAVTNNEVSAATDQSTNGHYCIAVKVQNKTFCLI